MAGNKPGKNIIQKQTIELHYNGSADGLALQQQLGNWCHEKLLPAMGMVLDESAQDSLYRKIENIQIETSITGTGDWLPILLQRIIEQFKDKINATPDIASQKAELVHHISPDENFRELLFYFLQYGYLPWWGAITSKEEFNNRLEEWLQQAPDGYPEAILPLLNNQLVRKRIVSQFTDKAFALFIARLLKVQPPEIVTILEDLPVISRSISASAEQVAAYNFK